MEQFLPKSGHDVSTGGFVLRFAVIVIICSFAGCSSDSGGRSLFDGRGDDDRIDQPGEMRDGEECTAVGWNDGPRIFNCSRWTGPTVEPWECDCDGTDQHEVAPEGECKQAIIDECGATDDAFGNCTIHGVGTCLADGDDWRCACDGDTDLQPVIGTTCERAIWEHCGTSCETDTGSCNASGEVGQFVCYCPYYDATRSAYAENCEAAIDGVCKPSGRACNGFNGYCDEVPSKGGYQCNCIDGTTGVRTYEELGTDDCRLAMEDVCGLETESGHTCERVADSGGRSRCTRDLATDTFDCQCTEVTEHSTRSWSEESSASDCETALEEACG